MRTHFDDRAALLALLTALFRLALVRVHDGDTRQPLVCGLVLLLRHSSARGGGLSVCGLGSAVAWRTTSGLLGGVRAEVWGGAERRGNGGANARPLGEERNGGDCNQNVARFRCQAGRARRAALRKAGSPAVPEP